MFTNCLKALSSCIWVESGNLSFSAKAFVALNPAHVLSTNLSSLDGDSDGGSAPRQNVQVYLSGSLATNFGKWKSLTYVFSKE